MLFDNTKSDTSFLLFCFVLFFCKNSSRLKIICSLAKKLHHWSLRGFPIPLSQFPISISGPIQFFQRQTNFKYTCLPKPISIEQFWSTFHTNTLLAEIWSQYELWSFKIHCPLNICRFSSLGGFSLIKKTILFLHS